MVVVDLVFIEYKEASMEGQSEKDYFETPYSAMTVEEDSLVSDSVSKATSQERDGTKQSGDVTREPLLLDHSHSIPSERRRKNRTASMSMSLKNTWKHVREELSSEKRVVADAFIDSNQNMPQYAKKEYSSDLLV